MRATKREIETVVDHMRNEEWFKDAIKADDDARARRTEIANRLALKQDQWIGKPASMQQEKIAEIKAQIEADLDKEGEA